MSQGNIINTGNPLDLAVEGEGYFVLSDGEKNTYTRSGSFAVDANSNLVDPATGYLVQRIGSVGEIDGFQTTGINSINVPYDTAMAANATSSVTVAGNLSSDAMFTTPQTNVLKSDITFTTNGGTAATGATDIDDLDQFTGAFSADTGTLTISGYNHDGDALLAGAGSLTLTVDATTDLDAVITKLNPVLSDAANLNADGSVDVASISNGHIVITDGASGYSRSDIKLAYTPGSDGESLTLPGYFEVSTVGGEEVKNASITIYDSHGVSHSLSAAFVRTDTANTWDIILTSITGDINGITFDNRRINGIEFAASDGSYGGLSAVDADTAQFAVTFAHDTTNPQTIAIDLGTTGQFNGLTQFAGNSTAVAREQDGYEAGRLVSASVTHRCFLKWYQERHRYSTDCAISE
ncbi:hypothetical protein ES703_116673 [subsurface metagenome]